MTNNERLVTEYRGKRILLDSNLLLLFLIGSYERARVNTFKRTSTFSILDFDALVAFVGQFSTIVTTPHLLTEVSNLANSLPDHVKPSWCNHFQARVSKFTETYQPAVQLMQCSAFNPFGLADAALQEAASDTLVLTEDFRLSGFLATQGISVLNFRDIRLAC